MNNEIINEAREEINAEIVVLNDNRNAKLAEINAEFDTQLAEKQVELKALARVEAKLPIVEVVEEVCEPLPEVAEIEPLEVQ